MIKEADARKKQYIKTLLNKDIKDLRFCVIGAGHGGLAMTGHLGLMGFKVNLFNRGQAKISSVSKRKGIKVEGDINGFGKIEMASKEIKECLHKVDVVMVVVPANAHQNIARLCAPYQKKTKLWS